MNAAQPSSLRKILRLLGYARPYAWLVVLTILTSLVYAAGDNARAYLIRPLLDDVLLPTVQQSSLDELTSLKESTPDAQQAEEAVQETQKIINLFRRIMIKHFAIEIPELQSIGYKSANM